MCTFVQAGGKAGKDTGKAKAKAVSRSARAGLQVWWVRPMTAGSRRPPQDTISSDILGTTKVQAAISHDLNQCKAVTTLFQVQFWCIYLYVELHVASVPLPQDRAAGRYKPPQDTVVILLCRLAAVIDVLRHSCGQVDWQLTKLNYTCIKNSNNITRNSVLRRSVASCGHWTDRVWSVLS